jgi:sugar (pentulose or hexulose) kinase
MTNIIGLDLGTTNVTGVLLDAGRREVLRLAQRRNDAALPAVLPTRAEQDPQRLRTLAMEVLAELAAGGEPVDGLALTGQKHGVLCVDDGGQPLTPLITWQDRRTAEPLPGGSTALERLRARLAGLGWRQNGCRVAHGYGAATLFWLAQQGKLPPETHRVCTIANWLASQLAANPVQTDPTFAASWGVYDLLAGGWNAEFLERLGLEGRLFPPVQPSGERLGGLVPAVAQETGLPADVPVYNAVGDTQASFLGSVADPEQTILFNLGTGGQICWLATGFELPSETVETRPLPGRRSLRVGASLCGGAAYAWLNATVRAWLAEFGVQVDEESAYQRLNALAAACDDVQGLRVRTTFLGVRGSPAVKAGAIEGIALDPLQLGALARATLVGIVDELRDLYRAHEGEPARHALIVAAGGGVSRNPLLPGLIAERFGLPVEVPRQRETAAIGAADLAISLYPDPNRWRTAETA